jgi:polyhydroxyalkanoate synthesis regulator phasin
LIPSPEAVRKKRFENLMDNWVKRGKLHKLEQSY